MSFVNPNSLLVTHGLVEPSITKDPADARYQFERTGYFWRDPVDSRGDALVFNRIITLKDTWAKKAETAEPKAETKTKPDKKPETAAPQAPARVALDSAQETVFSRLRTQGVGENEAHLLARDSQLAAYLEGADGKQVAELASWVVNDLAAAIR